MPYIGQLLRVTLTFQYKILKNWHISMNHISYRQEKKFWSEPSSPQPLHPSISRGYMQWAHPHFLSMALWILGLGYHVQPDLSNPTDIGVKKLIGIDRLSNYNMWEIKHRKWSLTSWFENQHLMSQWNCSCKCWIIQILLLFKTCILNMIDYAFI